MDRESELAKMVFKIQREDLESGVKTLTDFGSEMYDRGVKITVERIKQKLESGKIALDKDTKKVYNNTMKGGK